MGIMIFVTGMLAGVVWEKFFTTHYLKMKAKRENRTAVCVGKEFYYIMPEKEYVEGLFKK